ncbi:Na+/H+ antiporter [Paenibacillus sp. BIHB 4019]|uniref:Na+/H+ antiporter n=1 Tax=Paenibacillus sp. BIHB 4019 TaxID=1870819 RepID=A0A1B2DED7_9BACL|nr:Na+/H+ antiporter [Paenibacillus sp. BIHB 4019]ANY66081.1 Na+/H+ antiporter [Paenibacillus sp. BIHB 4019]
MAIFSSIIVLLALIGLSNIINRHLPVVPVPLIQIALGIAITLIPSGVHMTLEPELFFILFVAPLLYNDGKHTPRNELWRLRAPIFLLAVGLVFVTVFLIGYAIHFMIPSIPLPSAFGLAALLSPTDAVAVNALAGRVNLPKSLRHLLEGEALMNDASGLVAFKFAMAAALNGTFSLTKASISFVVIATGGLAVGCVLAFLITGLRAVLRRSGLEDPTLHMLIHMLTPFALYLTGEHLGVSGILAAVAGGVVHAVERDEYDKARARNDEMPDHTWPVILYILNGLVFVILGLQIPVVFSTVFDNPAINSLRVTGYACLIFVMLLLLRFLWTYAFSRGGRLFGSEKLSIKILAMTSLSGVRGAITLAGAFSIPLLLIDGNPFPERNVIIFIATAVILLSLLVASTVLPLLASSSDTGNEAKRTEKERQGQLKMMNAAIQAIHQAASKENEAETSAVLAEYERWFRMLELQKPQLAMKRADEGIIDMRIEAFRIEREAARRMLAQDEISKPQFELFEQSLEQLEQMLAGRRSFWPIIMKKLLNSLLEMLSLRKTKSHAQLGQSDREALRRLKLRACDAVIGTFDKQLDEHRSEERSELISHYHFIKEKLQKPRSPKKDGGDADVQRDLHWVAIQAERVEVQSLYERGEINREIANKLRQFIRNREASILEEG